jgi:hypothetical protein
VSGDLSEAELGSPPVDQVISAGLISADMAAAFAADLRARRPAKATRPWSSAAGTSARLAR